MTKLRKYNAEYYDAFKPYKDDILFYKRFVSGNVSVLELGCGTGRVTIPLSKKAQKIIGVDICELMIERAKKKTKSKNTRFLLGDITSINLNTRFDLVIAPFRVLQALEKKNHVLQLLQTIKKHLKPKGLAILNVFNPYLSKNEMKTKWIKNRKTDYGKTILKNKDILKQSEVKKRIDTKNQVFYVDLVYRRLRNNKLIDKHINSLCMRYYYPKEFKNLISNNGFTIENCWGGYNGETYGRGPELVVSFKVGNLADKS